MLLFFWVRNLKPVICGDGKYPQMSIPVEMYAECPLEFFLSKCMQSAPLGFFLSKCMQSAPWGFSCRNVCRVPSGVFPVEMYAEYLPGVFPVEMYAECPPGVFPASQCHSQLHPGGSISIKAKHKYVIRQHVWASTCPI